jgi:hypothetical protein
MKKILFTGILLCLFLIEPGKNAFSQWYLDTPTPAEMQAHDQPYIILQNEIQQKLCNSDWSIDNNSFSIFKDNPDSREVVRGKNIYYFDLSRWEGDCEIRLKQTSPLYKAIIDSLKKVNARLDSNIHTGLTLQEATADAMKNGGKIPAKDQAILDKKGIIQKKCMKDMALLGNAQQFAQFSLSINENWTDEKKGDAIKPLLLPGVQQAVLSIGFPNENQPDTTYQATLYIGNWPKPDMHKMLPFHFKYNTSYGWADKQHSGPPVIENFKIFVQSYHYNWLMKSLNSIDWTKLDKLIKST